MDLENGIISKSEATDQGLNRYFTGKPCKYGHISERWTISGKCIECKTNRDRSGRNDGKKLDPSAINSRSIPMPALDETNLTDLNLVHMDTTGISNEKITREEWISLALVVNKVDSFKQWLIGDLWNLCEWGVKSNMMDAYGINPKTATEYGRVAARIPHDMRRGNVSFSAHQELCVQAVDSDDKMVMLLDKVEVDKMSANQVRSMMKKLQRQIEIQEENPEITYETTKHFLKTYKKLGKQLKALDEIPASLQAALDNLIYEFQQLEETDE